MRDYKKTPQAAQVGGLRDVTDLDLPYSVISGDGQGGFQLADVPYLAQDGGRHGEPFTQQVPLIKAGRT